MGTIRNRGGRKPWHAQVRMTGFPSRSGSFPTERMAKRWVTKIEADMIEGRHFRSVEARRRTVSEAITRYLTEEVSKKRSAATRTAQLEWWRGRLGALKLSELSAAVIVECRNELARGTFTRARPDSAGTTLSEGEKPRQFVRSAATVKRYLAALRHLTTIARKEWHWLSHNPFDGVSMPKEPRGRVRYLSDEERGRLLAETAKDPVLHTVTVLALSTAARAGEVTNLQWSDIELGEGRVLLRVTKNGQARTVWIHGETLRLLKEHGRVRHLGDDRVFVSAKRRAYRYHKPFVAACEAAGIKNFRFHDLRHSAATYMAREGATEQQLKAIGGWKSGVVSRYVHLAAEDAKGVLEKLSRKINGEPQKP